MPVMGDCVPQARHAHFRGGNVQQSATGVFRVRFTPVITPDTGDGLDELAVDEPGGYAGDEFARKKRAAGAMVVRDAFPSPVTIGASRYAADRIGNLSFVTDVDPLVDPQ